jgi:toxin-antitoxin system PIN domain toxin
VPVYLLDANVLISLAWPQHEAHERVGGWFARHSRAGWATCPLTQAAFVRILSNPAFSPEALTPRNALHVLETNLELPGHHYWPDSPTVPNALKAVKGRLTGHRQITDAYLVGLAVHNQGRLATLDVGIRGWAAAGAVEIIE